MLKLNSSKSNKLQTEKKKFYEKKKGRNGNLQKKVSSKQKKDTFCPNFLHDANKNLSPLNEEGDISIWFDSLELIKISGECQYSDGSCSDSNDVDGGSFDFLWIVCNFCLFKSEDSVVFEPWKQCKRRFRQFSKENLWQVL